MSEYLPENFLFTDGLEWSDYLEIAAGAEMQKRRYEKDPGEEILAFFRNIRLKLKVVILSDPSCADCAWSVPHIMRLLDEIPKLDTMLFIKAANPELMNVMLTKGKQSTPKIAVLGENSLKILGLWGPRPAKIQQYVEENVGKIPPSEWKPNVFKYYREDGLSDLYSEIRQLFSNIFS